LYEDEIIVWIQTAAFWQQGRLQKVNVSTTNNINDELLANNNDAAAPAASGVNTPCLVHIA